jgi:hypothetical protein
MRKLVVIVFHYLPLGIIVAVGSTMQVGVLLVVLVVRVILQMVMLFVMMGAQLTAKAVVALMLSVIVLVLREQ